MAIARVVKVDEVVGHGRHNRAVAPKEVVRRRVAHEQRAALAREHLAEARPRARVRRRGVARRRVAEKNAAAVREVAIARIKQVVQARGLVVREARVLHALFFGRRRRGVGRKHEVRRLKAAVAARLGK